MWLLLLACNPDPALHRWHTDLDRDGYGDPEVYVQASAPPTGTVADGTDCDDANPSVHPDADERCDDHDDDCNGTVDDSAVDAPTWYVDADHDGFGDDAITVQSCQPAIGLVTTGGDCDDQDPSRSPVVPEDECSPIDLNCDGFAGGVDADGDGWALCEECDDARAETHPGASETCNELDDNCDGSIDEDAVDFSTWWTDADGDGYGDDAGHEFACTAPDGKVDNQEDCDDTRDSSHPGAEEVPCDGLDNDCMDGDLRCKPVGEHDLADSESIVLGTAVEDFAGYGVRVGGDLDGDGRPEWGVGSPGFGGDIGAFFILTGTPSASVVLDASAVHVEGADSEKPVPWDTVDFLNDIDLDGYDEIGIGLIDAYDATYLFRGPITASLTLDQRDITISGTEDSWSIGDAMDSADIDGDGMSDLTWSTIGNAYVSGWGWVENAGRAWGLYGPVTSDVMTDDYDFRLVNSGSNMYFGYTLCAADLTGDGLAEVVAGAPCTAGSCSTAEMHGSAYVFEGPITGDVWAQDSQQLGDAMSRWRGGNTDTYELGTTLGCKGDVDGDGRADLLIGGPSGFRGDGTGAIYLVDGSRAGDLGVEDASWRLSGNASATSVGWKLSSEGDIDGDGANEVLTSWDDATYAGTVGLFYGGSLSGTVATSDADATWRGHSASDWALFMASGGDLDADGFDDILIGAPGEDTNGDRAGAAYVAFGGGYVP